MIDGGGGVVPGASARFTSPTGRPSGAHPAHEPGALHRYDMADMNSSQRMLCTNMVSEWRFRCGRATWVVWRFTPSTRRGGAVVPAARVTARLFRRAMQRCLDNFAAALPVKIPGWRPFPVETPPPGVRSAAP